MTSTVSFDPAQLGAVSGQAVGLLKLLANPERMQLLCELSQGERSVSELEARLAIRQPTLSQQLGVLRTEGLVGTRREGKHIHYRVADPACIEILAVLHRLFCPRSKS
ncbi:MAG TPA: metalloregulator ArsR/SmtB family transcription factor [Ramlibacter sp.]